MRALVIALLVALAAPASAEAPAAPDPIQLPTHGRVEGVAIDPADLPITDLDQGRGTRRPSGFWTGYKPARSGAYRWPLVGLAGGIIAVTSALLVFGLRRVRRRPLTS